MSITNARALRTNMTVAERKLWKLLRSEPFSGWKFRRQHPIGKFVADFACVEALLIVEVDGGQHCENTNDDSRTEWLESCGWRVLRFWNNEVLQNITGVAEALLNSLSPMGEGGAHPKPLAQDGRVRVSSQANPPSPGPAVPAGPPSPIGERANRSHPSVQGEMNAVLEGSME